MRAYPASLAALYPPPEDRCPTRPWWRVAETPSSTMAPFLAVLLSVEPDRNKWVRNDGLVVLLAGRADAKGVQKELYGWVWLDGDGKQREHYKVPASLGDKGFDTAEEAMAWLDGEKPLAFPGCRVGQVWATRKDDEWIVALLHMLSHRDAGAASDADVREWWVGAGPAADSFLIADLVVPEAAWWSGVETP